MSRKDVKYVNCLNLGVFNLRARKSKHRWESNDIVIKLATSLTM